MFKSSLEPYRWDSLGVGTKIQRRSHARCYRRCFARVVVAVIYCIPRDVRSDPSAARDRSRFVRSSFPDRAKCRRLKQEKPMIGLLGVRSALPIVAAIIVCAAGLIVSFAFASLHLHLP
jgi:hypothetical protein